MQRGRAVPARQAHNLEVAGWNPAPATTFRAAGLKSASQCQTGSRTLHPEGKELI